MSSCREQRESDAEVASFWAALLRILRIETAKDAGRDSIWKFILQNTYKPVFLKNRFDFVIGNPPWLTYSGITNADYQAEIKRLADDYQVTPASKARCHLADQHDMTRGGETKGVKLISVLDLEDDHHYFASLLACFLQLVLRDGSHI